NIPAPLQISNLDPAMLKAEAQAIDIQIQLINLSYDAVNANAPSSGENESTPSVASPKKPVSIIVEGPIDSTSTSLSIDEALQQLSK
ncbi:MAG: hypothetical protein Q8P49_00875, partial [Candidatus Liptonbacteria bacterium]|nr:hypothetical protein [Candidatus Liptonbacteria bacterium]